jgi:hypothetical protein
MQRRRFNNIWTFPEDCRQEAKKLREEAGKLPHGNAREALLKRARQADTATWTSGFHRLGCCRRNDLNFCRRTTCASASASSSLG